MPNKAYLKGRQLEYKVKNFYDNTEWTCTRGAGSHGTDIVAVNWKLKEIRLISCTVDKPPEHKLKAMRKSKFTVIECWAWKRIAGSYRHTGGGSDLGFELRQGGE